MDGAKEDFSASAARGKGDQVIGQGYGCDNRSSNFGMNFTSIGPSADRRSFRSVTSGQLQI